MSTPFTSIQHYPRSPKVRKRNKRHRIAKKEVKLYLLTENMIIYIEKFKKSPKTQVILVSEFNKLQERMSVYKN